VSNCPGLHCDGCSGHGRGGCAALLVIGGIVVAAEALEWAVAHEWEILAGTGVVAVLAVAAVAGLVRWISRREARHVAARPFLTAREVPQIRRAAADLAASAERAAIVYRDLHIHLDGVPAAEQAQIIRQALGRGKE